MLHLAENWLLILLVGSILYGCDEADKKRRRRRRRR